MTAQTSTRAGKTAQIAEVKERFARMTSAVFVDYKGMNVDAATRLRAQFRKAGVEYKVVKNTIVKQALKDQTWAAKLDDVLVGMTGIAWSYEDPSAAAKVVKTFRKEEGDTVKLQVKGGLVDGSVIDGAAVETSLATMPGKDELRAMLLMTMQAPMQQFLQLLQAPAQNLVYVLKAREEQK
jgi:large subunit ribosomal protein L10